MDRYCATDSAAHASARAPRIAGAWLASTGRKYACMSSGDDCVRTFAYEPRVQPLQWMPPDSATRRTNLAIRFSSRPPATRPVRRAD